MQSAKFEKLENGNVLVTCSEVVDHPDHAPALQALCDSLQGATVGLVGASMVNSGEIEFRLQIVPNAAEQKKKSKGK